MRMPPSTILNSWGLNWPRPKNELMKRTAVTTASPLPRLAMRLPPL